ncbi:uncharacterized protein [Physcomitrium patens]|uniref:uncharacterized protein isoform X4 n=1 Tax=Physcomitrium patens TaxID=3218 RepID=UPI000D15381F|nr:uncharacterized protein LOC112280249 isoform X3 [Physcomitrium patens]|eukprot:XP_024371305.1 uncharacterized protein LOC112280249 isoform X3 [Physcomitrella patens]
MSFQIMERKIEIPELSEHDDDETLEDADPAVLTLSSSEASENWEKISEDWVSLFLNPAVLDEHARPLPSDLENYSQFDCTSKEPKDHFYPQELVSDSLLLHSTDDQLSSDLGLGTSTNVVEDIFGKEDPSIGVSGQPDLIHPKGEPLGHHDAAETHFPIAPHSHVTQVAYASTRTEVYVSTSPASSLTQVSGDSSSGMEVDLWKDKETVPDSSITLKRELTEEVSSHSESPTSLSSVTEREGGASEMKEKNPQSDERGVGSRDVSGTGSAAGVATPSAAAQLATFSVRQLQNFGNVIKVGLLARPGDRGVNVEDREESNKPLIREKCEIESVKMQNQEVSEDQQSDQSDADRKGEACDEDDEKRRARLMRNRESAQLSRQRKKVYVDELEGKLRTMTATVADLNATISHLTAENLNLRRQLGYYYPAPGVCPPRPGMPMQVLPMGPYPGMVAGRPMYLGGQMPPVPIPRMKTQTPARSTKRAKTGATNEGGDRKRVKLKAAGAASVAVMGLLCVAMLFGSVDPGLKGSSGVKDNTRVGSVRVGARVLASWDEAGNPLNHIGVSSWDNEPGWLPLREGEYGPEREGVPSIHTRLASEKLQYAPEKSQIPKTELEFSAQQSVHGNETLGLSAEQRRQPPSDYFSSGKAPLLMGSEMVPSNTSQSFAASVFVPGANGLVKVDGNLIIQAIMAGDRAAKKQSEKKSKSVGKKKGKKQSEKTISEGQAMKGLSVKVWDNLAPSKAEVIQNATTGPFVTARPLPGKVKSVLGTNNPVSPVLHGGALQQWMLGGLHEPKICQRNISDTKESMPSLTRNDKSSGASILVQTNLPPLTCNKLLHRKAHDKDTCCVPTLGNLHWAAAAASTEIATAESRQCLSADRPVLNTGMCTELFQFDTAAAASSAGQASTSEAKNVAESVAAKAAQGSPHNITSTLSGPIGPRSRRDPFAVPLPPVNSKPPAKGEGPRNGTDPRVENLVREQLHGQNLRDGISSMVVSVMAGPEEYGDSRRKGTKGLSRIFVVVLVDNQKYVTYSCILPSGGPQAHVVAE